MYGKASRIYTEREKDSLFVKTHVIELAGLLPGNCYYFVVNGTDQSGSAESSEYYIYHFRSIKSLQHRHTSNPYPSIAGTHNGTITTNQTIIVTKLYTYPCEAQAGIPNMLASGTKHGKQPQLGTATQATGITSPSTRPLFFYPTKLTTTLSAQAPIHRFTTIRL